MGNPYHVMKLLEFLQWEGLLVQNSNTGSWEFDVDQIQKEVMISITLAEILASRSQIGFKKVSRSPLCLDIASLRILWYRACVHLFHAPHFVRHDANRIELARLHLEAAKYCKEKSAFIDAATALRRGLSLLDADARKWTDFYDLAFEMTETLARMELIVGNHDACTQMTNEVLHRAKTTSMRINALLIGVECVMSQNDMEASIAAANRALFSLGMIVPRKASFRLIGSKLFKVKLMLGRKSDDDILSLPLMKDEVATATSRILVNLCTYCFLKDEANLGVYAALLALQSTLNGGLNAYSACALAIYGVAQLSSGNFRGAYRFGKLALALQDKMQVRDAECATTVLSLTLLIHRYESLRGMTEILRRAASIGFEVGDVLFGSYCLAMVYGTQAVLGTNLEQLEATMRADARSLGDSSQEAMDMWTQPVIQYVLNLRNDGSLSWQELTILTGEFMDEETYIRRALASNHRILVMMTLNYKAILACCFGFCLMAESILMELMSMGKTFFYSYGTPSSFLFGGIASYSCYQQNGKRKHLKLARMFRRRLASIVSRGCPNSPPYLLLLDAEDLAVRKSAKHGAVSAAYNTAIGKLNAMGFPHTEAYALERAGFFQARLGNYDDAAFYFQKALDLLWHTCGSIARHDWLVEQSERALGSIEAKPKPGPLIHSIVETCKGDVDV
ncbi:serine threonine protein kinase [Fragilaria crotonensis]|nr:serine threonine protein kinase [Fragilaria crotonensis]